jgi:hypothetical protein
MQQRRQQPQRVAEIDAEIRDRFAVTRAIVVLDMVGFSRTTQENGIIPTLENIYHLREIAVPTLQEHDGSLLKLEADNFICHVHFARCGTGYYGALIDSPQHSRLACQHWHRLRGSADGRRSRPLRQRNESGFKLGEDLAGPDEILLTAAAHTALAAPEGQFTAFTETISGVTLTLFRRQQPE